MGQVRIPAPPVGIYESEPPPPTMMNPMRRPPMADESNYGRVAPLPTRMNPIGNWSSGQRGSLYGGGLGSLSNMIGTTIPFLNAGNNLPNMPGGMPGPAMPGQFPGSGFPGYNAPYRSLYPGMGTGPGGVRTADFRDANQNGIDDRDEKPGRISDELSRYLTEAFNSGDFIDDFGYYNQLPPADPNVTLPQAGAEMVPPDDVVYQEPPPDVVYQEPPPMEIVNEGGMGAETVGDTASSMLDQPPASDYTYVPSITRADSRMDPITQQLLFGLGGEGGFIPGAMRAARSTFFDDQGRARVIPKEIAGFSPDEVRAFELARDVPTVMDPYIQRAEEAYKGGLGEFDPSTGIQPYMDPFEDAVVKQTMSDIMEAGAQRDISARAGDIARGGESAFGSRARLGAAERERALGRGLGEAIGALRSRGFEGARSAAMGEFARNQMGERGFGGFLSGLGTQKQGGLLSGIGALTGTGGLQRGMSQADLDARREAAMQGQAAPLSMFQALSPFINMAPRGTTSFNTQFGVPPNPLTTGIGTALAALGAFGDYFGGLGSLGGGQQRTT